MSLKASIHWRCLGLVSLSLALANAAPASGEAPFIRQQSEHLYSAVEQAVHAAGGDLEKQHVHLVFAFSTGHFAQDPVMAQVAREVASDVAADHLVNGDQLSGYAWEMNVWPHKGAGLNPFTVGADRAAMRASFQDLWPRSPQAGSAGGHDTEAAIAELTSRLRNSSDAVLVLLTNSAASQAGAPTQHIIGENNPAYLSALKSWNRVKTSSTTGATVQLAVRADQPDRTFDAVVVVPKRFRGATLSAPRTELVTTQLTPKPVSRFPWWALGVGVLVVLAGLLAVRARNSRPASVGQPSGAPSGRRTLKGLPKLALQVGDRTFPLESADVGETLCVLCGAGYPVGTSPGRYVALPQTELPAIRLLTVVRERQGLKMIPETDVQLSGDQPVLVPFKEAQYKLQLSGRAPRPNLPPRAYQAAITLKLIPTPETEN